MQNQELSRVVTIEAAASLYKDTSLTPSAIRRLVRSGEIPSRKVGAKYLITAASIETWLNSTPEQENVVTNGQIRRVLE